MQLNIHGKKLTSKQQLELIQSTTVLKIPHPRIMNRIRTAANADSLQTVTVCNYKANAETPKVVIKSETNLDFSWSLSPTNFINNWGKNIQTRSAALSEPSW